MSKRELEHNACVLADTENQVENKRARNTVNNDDDANISCNWESIRSKIQSIEKSELIDCLADHWNNGKDLRQFIADAANKAYDTNWVTASDQSKILDYDWDPKMKIKSDIDSKKRYVTLCTYMHQECQIDSSWFEEAIINDADAEGKLVVEDEEGEWGCVECEVAGSSLTLQLQQRGNDELRLVVWSSLWCGCHHYPGEVVCESEIYYPL